MAESSAQVVGYTMSRLEHGFSDLKKLRFTKKGHIISVAVIPEYRNIGIGHSLVDRALSALAQLHVDECYLEVRITNGPAINLYKKMGLRIEKTLRNYYSDDENAYVMSKKLE